MKLCDLHTHVLPGVDDGAQTMEYALQMLRNAVASDVVLLAVTPHCNLSADMENYLDEKLTERFFQLQQAAKDIPIQLVLGAEARVNKKLVSCLKQGVIPTINGSRYLLTEFPSDTAPKDFTDMLRQILSLGYTPLVAHPERYTAVCQAPQMVLSWLDMGCHIQLSAGSILGEYGKSVQQASTFLLRHDLVACVASDAHGVNHRSNFLLNVHNHLSVQYSKQYANCLMYESPLRICRNEAL